MSDLKVSPGDPISATKHNSIVDRLPGISQGFAAGGEALPGNMIRIKNNSGSDRDLGEGLVVNNYDGPNTSEKYRLAAGRDLELECVDPVWHTSIARLVVLAEPIGDGERGLAYISGRCLVPLTDTDSSHRFVMIDPDTPHKFKTAHAGIGRLFEVITATSGDDMGIINFRDECNRWKYKLTQDSQAPGTTTAQLLDRDETVIALSINLSDSERLMDDQETDDKGWCDLCGNEFQAIAASCKV